MAIGSLLTLLDDIASILDDVSVLTKVAAKKTVSVLGDDLALNAEQVSGVKADRELPVVWAVTKGSLRNKLILVPLALLISAFFPWAPIPLLMIGGIFLCFEGTEKILHSFIGHKKETNDNKKSIPEKEKIAGAIRTDFILSAEIIVITLGTVSHAPLSQQIVVVSSISFIMTLGVYGLVAGIVKLDDLGLYLAQLNSKAYATRLAQPIGRFILRMAPHLMRTLSIVGTIAMFIVGGGILAHGIPLLSHFTEHLAHQTAIFLSFPGAKEIALITIHTITGVILGLISLCFVAAFKYIKKALT